MQYSVVYKSDLEFSSRLDSEYYRKDFLEFEKAVFSKSYDFLSALGEFTVGPFGSAFTVDNYDPNSKFRYIRGKDVKEFFIKDDDNVYMPEEDYKRLEKYSLRQGDILISVVGTLGNVSYIIDETPAIFSCKSTAFTSQNIQPEYLVCYLNTKYGQALLKRKERGAIQKGLNLDDLKTVPVYLGNEDIRETVSDIITDSKALISLSNQRYAEAEHLILDALNLSNWKPHHQLSFAGSFSDIESSNRIDAEYFQPMYEEIIQAVKAVSHDELGGLVTYAKGVEVGTVAYTEDGVPFIRVSDISEKGIERTEKTITEELYQELAAKHSPRKGDVLMTKDGTIGRAFVVQEDVKAILSGAFLKLRLKKDVKIDREYLALVINSLVCKQQIEKMSGGAIIAHLKPSDAMQLVIPILDEPIQANIAAKITESRAKREQSKALLEVAKRGVEMAIEQDEAIAQSWIEKQLQALGV